MGEFSRNVEKVCAKILKDTIGGRKLWGNVSRNLEKICANFRRNNMGGRKLWGNFSRNLGKICANFQKNNIGGRKLWGNFPEIWRRYARIAKETIKHVFGRLLSPSVIA